jgi:hypothetical protein
MGTGPNLDPEGAMQDRLDELARALAGGMSRRRALRRIGGGLSGGALAMLGIGRASAAQPPQAVCDVCMSRFIGQCVAVCARTQGQETCGETCRETARAVCTLLGECT